MNNSTRRKLERQHENEKVVYAAREGLADRSSDAGLACRRNEPLQSGRVQWVKSNAPNRPVSSIAALDLGGVHSVNNH